MDVLITYWLALDEAPLSIFVCLPELNYLQLLLLFALLRHEIVVPIVCVFCVDPVEPLVNKPHPPDL